MQVEKFVFGPFAENTYIIHDDTGECLIIDPGFTNDDEWLQIKDFIINHQLKPVKLINTHCHLDHILGNRQVENEFGLKPEYHKDEESNLKMADEMAPNMGIEPPKSPSAQKFLEEGDVVTFGNSRLKVIFTPGHAAGHISFVPENENFVISGDVIFEGSIGRTDLPGGNYETLIKTILEKFMVMEDHIRIYPGHGPQTTVGFERKNNPFVLAES